MTKITKVFGQLPSIGLSLLLISENDDFTDNNKMADRSFYLENSISLNLFDNAVNKMYFEIEKEKHLQEEMLRKELEMLKIEEERISAEKKLAEELELKKKEESKILTFEATYYTPKCKGCIGITKSGYDVRNTIYYNGMRIIAVDPKIIPLHTVIDVETPYESFRAIALDTGGSIKNYRIDILVKTEKEAFKLGRHDVKIKIVE